MSTPTTTASRPSPGSPHVVRSTAGRFETPVGEVVAVASEHDAEAGTSRGPNTIFVFTLDGVRVCHFGDFGQSALRPEQREAIGAVDLLIVPVGGGPTIGAAEAAEITRALDPRWVVPMHYRTAAIDFLEPADAFLALFEEVVTAGSEHAIEQDGAGSTGVLHLAAPDGRELREAATMVQSHAVALRLRPGLRRRADRGGRARPAIAIAACGLCCSRPRPLRALAASGGRAPLRPRRACASSSATSLAPPPQPATETARPARTGTVAGIGEVTSSRKPQASAATATAAASSRRRVRRPDDRAEQRRREEVEPAHARVAQVDLLQRGQRPGVVATRRRAAAWRAGARPTSRSTWRGAPHQVHVDARSGRSARARGSGPA